MIGKGRPGRLLGLPVRQAFGEKVLRRGVKQQHVFSSGSQRKVVMSKQQFLKSGRRQFLGALTATGIGSLAFQRALAAQVEAGGGFTKEMIAQAEWIAGIELDDEAREDVAKSIEDSLESAKKLRAMPVDADTVPVLVFRPDFFYQQANPKSNPGGEAQVNVAWEANASVSDMSEEELAFASISDQASLLASKQISSRELTQLYLRRLKKYDPLLHCVITMLEDHALESADASDKRRGQGKALGVLDGIPWVAKDLVAVPPWKTTWGAEPFRHQVRDTTATVAEKMSAAGAVLMAKVTLGAMAWGDQWFGGMTRNPWNPEQGSSGSSAGSASAVAAGLASFALGSETLGSIVSPTRRCRTSGLRPTFGRVSRAGCMPLAWSMDKIGPIARHVEDLALVFASLVGPDQMDPTLVERDFNWPLKTDLKQMRIGVTDGRKNSAEEKALDFLREAGAEIVEIDLTVSVPEDAMSFILGVEASTVFDDAFRADPLADYGNWPSTFRQSQFVPAIQYLRANRMRSQLVCEAEERFSQVDVVLGGNDLLLTNLSGHPSIVVACTADQTRDEISLPGVVKLTAAAYQEEKLLHVAQLIQQGLPPQPSKPPLDDWLAKMSEGD